VSIMNLESMANFVVKLEV